MTTWTSPKGQALSTIMGSKKCAHEPRHQPIVRTHPLRSRVNAACFSRRPEKRPAAPRESTRRPPSCSSQFRECAHTHHPVIIRLCSPGHSIARTTRSTQTAPRPRREARHPNSPCTTHGARSTSVAIVRTSSSSPFRAPRLLSLCSIRDFVQLDKMICDPFLGIASRPLDDRVQEGVLCLLGPAWIIRFDVPLIVSNLVGIANLKRARNHFIKDLSLIVCEPDLQFPHPGPDDLHGEPYRRCRRKNDKK